MSDKALTTIIAIIFIFVLGLTVALGISASSFWVGALAFVGVFLSLGSIGSLGTVEKVGFSFYITHVLAVTALAFAAWLAHLQPLWMVIVLMAFSTLSPIFASDYGFKQSKGEGYLAVVINLVSTPLAIALPALVMNASAGTLLTPQTWAWSLALAGLAVLSVGLLQAGVGEPSPYFVCLSIGLVPLIGSAVLIHFELSWLWLLPWVAAALLIGVGGAIIPRWRTKSGMIGIVLAVLVLVIGAGLSLMNYGILPNLFEQRAPQTVAQVKVEGTLSAADQAATQLAAAAATATQAVLDEQLGLTQTQQALAAAQQQTDAAAITPTPTPEPTPTPAPTATAVDISPSEQGSQTKIEGPGFFKAVGAFLWFAIKSVKGIGYLILLIGIGQAWLKRWGGWILFLVLLLAVGFFGGANLATLNTMTNVITTGPTAWWTHILLTSLDWTGTMGWGIMAFVLLITLLLLPAIKFSSQLSQQAFSTQGAQNDFGLNDIGCRESLATMTYLLASSSFPITLWVALHRISSASANKFPFLFIPDLTVPNWRPVWHYSYFLLGGIFLLSYFLYLRLLRKTQPNNVFTPFATWSAVFVGVALTLLAPAGLMLYLTVQMILLAILQPILALPQRKPRHVPHKVAPQPFHSPSPQKPPEPSPEKKAQDAFNLYLEEIRKKAEEEQREEERKKQIDEESRRKAMETKPEEDFEKTIDEEEEDLGKTIDEEEEERRRKAMETQPEEDFGNTIGELESEPLSTLSTPMVGGYLKVTNWLAVLDKSSKLFWLINGTQHSEVDLPLDAPLTLLSGLEDRLLAVGREGKVIRITASQKFEVSDPVEVESGIRHATANSFGTLLAYVPEENPTVVHGLFVGAQRDQLFLDLGSEVISCLAFSQNSRYLAAGTALGRIVVIDIATHQQILAIPDPYYGPVQLLTDLTDDSWVAIYGDGWMAIWDINGKQIGPVELTQPAGSLAVAKASFQILVGDRSGYIWGYPIDLRNLAFGKPVQEGEITRIFTTPEGALITAGEDRRLRKSTL